MVDASTAMFSGVYGRLKIDPRLTVVGESFYNSRIPAVLAELSASGLLEDSGGALVLKVPGYEVPLMVRKSDGGYGYDSTDMTALAYRLRELKADWLIYVVDAGQALHFDLVFGGAARARWFNPGDPTGPLIQHVGFGIVQGEDRKKLKTRSGETVRLADVLDEAKARAKAILMERAAAAAEAPAATCGGAVTSGVGANDDAAIDAAAAALGYGGVKYFDLRQHRMTDYVFSYDRMLSPDGDTTVYLQYAHARMCSILRRAAENGVDVAAVLHASPHGGVGAWAHPTELLLAIELARFAESVQEVLTDLLPHRLCEYLYRLAGRGADFHRDCNVLSATTPSETRDARLRLAAATAAVMKAALALLGIEALERI